MGVHDIEVCANGHPPIAHTEGYKNCPLCKAFDCLNEISGSITEGNFAVEGDLVGIKNIADAGLAKR